MNDRCGMHFDGLLPLIPLSLVDYVEQWGISPPNWLGSFIFNSSGYI
jgi:hypothetical protein